MSLEFNGITHAYGKRESLTDIQLSARSGEITCLLGPSGCGKTTLLKLAAGLLDVQSGEIRLRGETLANAQKNPPPEARPIGLVFQEGALFPHMTVADNVAFGIRHQADRLSRVRDLLDQVGLPDLEDRFPHTLSGGQQQRVALARALAPEPEVLLLDEPFAAVDIVRRRELREVTRRVLKDRNACAVLVTHDPDEAMDMADQIAVMETARIVQSGTPQDIYNRPEHASVGALFGDGQIVPARRNGEVLESGFGVWTQSHLGNPMPESEQVNVLVRPQSLILSRGRNQLAIEDIRSAGPHWRILVLSPHGERLWVRSEGDGHGKPDFAVGEPVSLEPKPLALLAFPSVNHG